MAGIEIFNEPIKKSAEDVNLYRYIKLSNGLCALLGYDPFGNQDDKAAVALSIGRGSFSEPKEAGGLAHLLEHMVYKGSKHFPNKADSNEDKFIWYIQEQGGEVNATTHDECTSFGFDVRGDFLEDALERFADFIISPLLRKNIVEREKSILHEEFMLDYRNDMTRLHQLKMHTCHPSYPHNKRFTWGNKNSFNYTDSVSSRERLSKFHGDFYKSEVMKLVVLGTSSLDTLEKWVKNIFGKIKRGCGHEPQILTIPTWERGKIFKLEALSKYHQVLQISWLLPSLRDNYLMKVDKYISFLFKHAREGSLEYSLKTRGWATQIRLIFDEKKTSSHFSLVTIEVVLSQAGSKRVLDIIDLVYQYIKVLRQEKPQKWVFGSLKGIAKSEFKNYKPKFDFKSAEKLAGNLWLYPYHHILYGEYGYEEWNPNFITTCLDHLKPENMRVDVVMKCYDQSLDFGGGVLQKKRKRALSVDFEPWYASKYTVEDIPIKLMELWDEPIKADHCLMFPSKRCIREPYLSKSLDAFGKIDFSGDMQPPESITFSYKKDNMYEPSHLLLELEITLHRGIHNLKNVVLMEIFEDTLEEELRLRGALLEADESGVKVTLDVVEDQLKISIYGLISRTLVFLSIALRIMTSLRPTCRMFKAFMKNRVDKAYRKKWSLANHCYNLTREVLYKDSWSLEDEMKMLHKVWLRDFNRFIRRLFSKVYVKASCCGNVSREDADRIYMLLKNTFTPKLLPIAERYKPAILRLPPQANYFVYRMAEKNQRNSLVKVHFQIGEYTVKHYVMAELLRKLVTPMLFHSFRYNEQLCYSPTCEVWFGQNILGVDFVVESSVCNHRQLLLKVENVIDDIRKKLNEVDEDTFSRWKFGVREELICTDSEAEVSDEDLKEQTSNSISKHEFIEWCLKFFTMSHPASRCRRVVFSIGPMINEDEKALPMKKFCKSWQKAKVDLVLTSFCKS